MQPDQFFKYNSESGILTHKPRIDADFPDDEKISASTRCKQFNTSYAGKEAGWVGAADGYRRVRFNGRDFLAHRIIWKIATGKWPIGQIDHINGNRSDNRISNLRDVPCATNRRNVGIRRDNTSGVSGVSWHRTGKKWCVRIVDPGGKYKSHGLYSDLNEAISKRNEIVRLYGYSERHGACA